MTQKNLSRRHVVATGVAGMAGLATGLAQAAPGWERFARHRSGEVVADSAFARIERLAEGIWAIVSLPFDHEGGFVEMATTCNGGIVAGSDGALVIDGFFTAAGAAWVSDQVETLTGMRPTHVAITHHHADHAGGLAGFQRGSDGPSIIATQTATRLIVDGYVSGNADPGEDGYTAERRRQLLPDRILPEGAGPLPLDLGGRRVRLEPHRGHTPSDLVAVIEDPAIVFDGDLIWDGVFPNYIDAIPSAWNTAVDALLDEPDRLHVTGHGSVRRAQELADFRSLLGEVETAARKAHESGRPVEDAARELALPESLGPWPLFNPQQYHTAFKAWYRELKA